MTSRSRLIILSLAVIGLAVAGYSTWVHYKLLTDASFISPCDVNDTFNCSQVYLSPYGSVRGVPVALFGVIWFGLVALVAGFADTSEDKVKESPSGAYVFALSTIGLAVVLSLGYTSMFILKTYCVLCMATYALVTAIFVVSGLSSSAPVTSLPSRLFRDLMGLQKRPLPLVLAVVFALSTGTVMGYFQGTEGKTAPMTSSAPPPKLDTGNVSPAAAASQDPHEQFEAWWNAQPRIETGVGLEGAKVVVVKFSDFQCPGCKQTWIMYSPVLEKYAKEKPGLVRYVMKDFPLNSNCNVAVQTQMHPFACEASMAYRAAVDHGKGHEMENWIFNNQAALTSGTIRAAAKEVGGIVDFDREGAAKIAGIKKDTADGGALQINSTPTFFINGIKLPTQQWLNPEYFDLAIQIELKRAGVAAAAQKAGGN